MKTLMKLSEYGKKFPLQILPSNLDSYDYKSLVRYCGICRKEDHRDNFFFIMTYGKDDTRKYGTNHNFCRDCIDKWFKVFPANKYSRKPEECRKEWEFYTWTLNSKVPHIQEKDKRRLYLGDDYFFYIEIEDNPSSRKIVD